MQTEQKNAFIVGFIVAFLCSILVSITVVLLKPRQDISRAKERVKTVVAAAGFDGYDAQEMFKNFVPLIVNLETGEYRITDDPEGWHNNFDNMLKDPERTVLLDKRMDIASLKKVPKEMLVYALYDDSKPSVVVLPVYGAGLWSVMYSYLGINVSDLSVSGIRFYEHGETPGLGGEIENIRWQTSWKGKTVYNYEGQPHFDFSKNPLVANSPESAYTVDALSGATLTTDGVKNIVYFWLGKNGYRDFLLKMKEAANE